MKRLVLGFILGVGLCFTATALADTAKEYILTKVTYPIFLNEQEFINTDLPFLNYEGNTYVPLKVTADMLGVPVNWNPDLNRVEIGFHASTEETKIKILSGYLESSLYPAVEYEGNIYLSIDDGVTKYDIAGYIQWNYDPRSIEFKHTDVIVPIGDKIEKDIDGLVYEGMAYVKESVLVKAHEQIKAYENKQLEEAKKEYPVFKALFTVEHKTLQTDNTVYVQANHRGNTATHLEELFDYLDKLGDKKQLLMQLYAIEIQQLNPEHPLDIRFNYYGVHNHFLASLSVSIDGTASHVHINEIANINPGSTELN